MLRYNINYNKSAFSSRAVDLVQLEREKIASLTKNGKEKTRSSRFRLLKMPAVSCVGKDQLPEGEGLERTFSIA
jgi:hypothetical protein